MTIPPNQSSAEVTSGANYDERQARKTEASSLRVSSDGTLSEDWSFTFFLLLRSSESAEADSGDFFVAAWVKWKREGGHLNGCQLFPLPLFWWQVEATTASPAHKAETGARFEHTRDAHICQRCSLQTWILDLGNRLCSRKHLGPTLLTSSCTIKS